MVAPVVQDAQSQSGASVLHLYPRVFEDPAFGMVLLHLDNPQDVKTCRIIDLNLAAAEITGSTVEGLLGKTLADFAKLLETPFLDQWLMAFRSKEAKRSGRDHLR